MRCYHSEQNGYGECSMCWEGEKSICSGCQKAITNSASFKGAHVRGKCRRPKGPELLPKPTVLIHPSRAMLAKKVTDGGIGYHSYSDWTRHPNGELRLPETYPELRQWWRLPPKGEIKGPELPQDQFKQVG